MSEKVIRPTDFMGKAILDAREERAEHQAELLKRYGKPLLVHRVNMPGAQKDTALSQRIFKAMETELTTRVEGKTVFKQYFLSAEGPVMIRVMDSIAAKLKTEAILLEDTHPLGRYVDLDVYAVSGESLSRTALGYASRSCYLCDSPTHECVRTSRHGLKDLLEAMETACELYENT